MADDILDILDKCLERIRRGETVEQCLADYPDYRLELEALLKTAQTLSAVFQVSPSAEFRQSSPARLVARIRAESVQRNRERQKIFDFSGLRRSLVFRTLVPVTLVVLVALIVWVALPVFSPEPVLAAEFTLSILSGNAEIRTAGSSTWLSGSDGMNLNIGSQVRTVSDSSALLTFFDGSTTKLEPGAEVLVSRSEYVNHRSTLIVLEQQSGKTWSYVQLGGEEKPYFAVQTPQVKAVAQGTAFSTQVDSSGKTRLSVTEGSIQVIEANRETRLEANNQIQVGDKIALSTPLPVPPAGDELIISTGLPGIGSVRDPSGASTGYLPDGLAFNQITNSKSVLSPEGQRIMINEPAAGEYVLAVRSISQEAIPIDIQAKRDGKVVFQYTDTLKTSSKDGWIIRIKLDTANQATISGDILSIDPLSGKAPENVVELELAKKRAVSLGVAPNTVTWGENCEVSVNVTNLTNFKAYQFNVNYDPGVLQVIGVERGAEGVTPGLIGSTAIPVDGWTYSPSGKAGTIRVVGHLTGYQAANGWGHIVKIHFKVISHQSQTVNINFTNITDNKLFDQNGDQIPAGSVTWTGTTVNITRP